jgi:hypothetical protein
VSHCLGGEHRVAAPRASVVPKSSQNGIPWHGGGRAQIRVEAPLFDKFEMGGVERELRPGRGLWKGAK